MYDVVLGERTANALKMFGSLRLVALRLAENFLLPIFSEAILSLGGVLVQSSPLKRYTYLYLRSWENSLWKVQVCSLTRYDLGVSAS